MPREDGSLVGIRVPQVWCPDCGLIRCVCEPVRLRAVDTQAAEQLELHDNCGTPNCCGLCPTAT